jgi:hypothetical protein
MWRTFPEELAMALTISRWIACVAAVCTLVTAAAMTADPSEPAEDTSRPESIDPELRRRVVTAARRWEALVRRDSAVAGIARASALPASAPLLVIDPLLPATHRSVIERAVARQWSALRIGTARVPVAIAVVIDTMPRRDLPTGGIGQMSHEYVLPAPADTAPRCIAVIALQSRTVVRPGTQRALTELAATHDASSSLLGACAFFARFGIPGARIHAWLGARSFDLAASPQWLSVGGDETAAVEIRWQQANVSAQPANRFWLSPDALGCTAGDTERCAASLLPDTTVGAISPDGFVMTRSRRDPHWGTLHERYMSDLVTAMGPGRFERFWRSELAPDAAIRAAAAVPLAAWTQQWASGLLGDQRVGPRPALIELIAGLTIAGLAFALAAWGWGRRQVR